MKSFVILLVGFVVGWLMGSGQACQAHSAAIADGNHGDLVSVVDNGDGTSTGTYKDGFKRNMINGDKQTK